MPVRRTRRKIGGAPAWWNKTKDWLRKTRILSKVGDVVAPMIPGALGMAARQAVNYGQSQGYGRRRIRRRNCCSGGSLYPVGARRGGAMAPVGGAYLSRVRRSGSMSSRLARPSLGKRMAMKF